MKFLIVTHTNHTISDDVIHAYAPYVKEMNIWGKHVDQISLVAPVSKSQITSIHAPYSNDNISLSRIPAISLTSLSEFFRAVFLAPVIMIRIFNAMRKADHIHLRCPGNIGLLGCLVQIFFPGTPKTAKYAGNWDPAARQPRSYKLQKWILGNTFLTKNMKVLVYGEWPGQSKNIVPFFTASYTSDMTPAPRETHLQEPYKFLFVGGLTPGKHPEYVVELVNSLVREGLDCRLDLYGEGVRRQQLKDLIVEYGLEERVSLHGNVSAAMVQEAYQTSHFLVLPSRSEGWPKVVSEAMFWGCIPLVSAVSCVPWMLDHGNRGGLLTLDLLKDIDMIKRLIADEEKIKTMSREGELWSHQYTLDDFEREIIKFVT